MAFAGVLKQSTAVDVLIGPFVDSTDGDTEETGLTIAQADVRLSKNGQTGAQKNDNTTCAHDADGFYNCELDATDTNTVGQLTLYVHVAGALAVRHDFQIVEEAIYDALFAASATGLLPANVTQFGGSAGTFASGRPEVNTTHIGGSAISQASGVANVNVAQISGDSTAADNLESYTDGTTPMPVNATQISGDATAADNLEAALDGTGGVTVSADLGGDVTGNVDGSVGSLAAQAKADVNAEADAAIETYHLDHLLAATYDPASKPGAADALLNELVENDGGVARFTENALEQAPTGGSAPTAEEVADAVWDEARADHTTAGSFGQGVASVQGNVTGSVASVTGNVGGNVTGSIGSLAAQAKADVNAEADTALSDYDPPTRTEATSDKDEILDEINDGVAIAAGGIDATAFAAGAIDSAALAQSAGQEIADEVLNRDLAGGGSGNTRNVRNALRVLRNKVSDDGAGTVTIFTEDDSTTAWTAATTRDANLDPLKAVDPSGP